MPTKLQANDSSRSRASTTVGKEFQECEAGEPQGEMVLADELKSPPIFDTPMKLKCGAKPITDKVNLDEFPLLKSIIGRLSTDHELRCLQREMLRLSGMVKSVNLTEMISHNDKARSMLLVPRSSSYGGFRSTAKNKVGKFSC